MTTPRTAREITDDDIDAIAAAVRADRRSILRRIAGLPVRGRVGEAIDRELAASGITGPAPEADADA